MTSPERDDGGHGPPVVLLLHGPKGPHPAGVAVPVRVELRNEGPDELWMVGVVDGSEGGVRYPHYLPTVSREGRVVAQPPPPEDPLVGPLRAVDFRRLAPGEAFDPTEPRQGAAYLPLSTLTNFIPLESGKYGYRVELSTESDHPDEWLGRFNQEGEREAVLALIAKVPRLRVASNSLEVEVR
ncbi:MAG: hypothetical protein ACRDK3_07035 [Actinomycetota bacterium]